jgi:hypothetical protein
MNVAYRVVLQNQAGAFQMDGVGAPASGYDESMMLSTQTLRGTALALCVAIGGSIATPVVALADSSSTAAAIAIGAIVGTLIYDSSRHQYYYVDNNRHVYVNNTTAQGWYQRQDPQYFRAHQNDFNHNPSQFDREYRSSHGHPHP